MHHILLTALGRKTTLVVVIKEAVQTRTVNQHVVRCHNLETPRHVAVGVTLRAECEGRVVPLRGLRRERRVGVGLRLEVWGLGLDAEHVDVARGGDLVVVEDAVFCCCAVHPGRLLGFDEKAAAVVDADLVVVGEIELVVGDPAPGVFGVESGLRSDLQQGECGNTRRVDVGITGGLGASVGLQVRASGAANTPVRVPHASRALLGALDIPLHEDGARLRAADLEDEVGDFNCANVANVADLKDWCWTGLRLER